MTKTISWLFFGGLLAVASSRPLEASPIVGQIDTFESLTTDGWSNGIAAADPPVLTGGPAGPAGHFLDIVATGGFGAGGRIAVFNRSQWTGDFFGSGIQQIEMDLRNFGQTALSIRLGFRDSTGPAFAPGEASTIGFALAADGAWHHAVFSIADADLSDINGATFGSLMGSVAEMRILHSAAPNVIGDPIVAQLGVDNIKAVGAAATVPEPSSMLLLGSGMLALFRQRNRWRTW